MNTADRYPFMMIVFHWLIAGAIFVNLIIGWLLDDATELMDLHRTVGTLILALSMLRLFNRFFSRRKIPASLNTPSSAQHIAEKIAHALLYAAMVAVPLLGWLKTNSAGHDIVLFDTIPLPSLIGKDHQLSSLFGMAHSISAYLLAMLIGLHIAGAIAHQVFGKKDAWHRIIPTLGR